MTKDSDKDFLKLTENERFNQLVKESKNSCELFEDLLNEFPDNIDSVKSAFDFIQLDDLDKKRLPSEDYNLIFQNVIEYNKVKKEKERRKLFYNYLWRAAIILIVVSTGVIFYQQTKKDSIEQFAENDIENEDQGMIILSDGSKRLLKENNSLIEYSKTEAEIIIKNTNKEDRRVENHHKEKKAVLNKVVVPFGQTYSVSLSDGTVIQLNAGSKLTFPAVFSGKNREVYLSGEGFFEVSKDENMPFIVKTGHLDVEVLGTTFNVSTYDDDKEVRTILVEGSVKILQRNKIFSDNEYILEPGQGCFYSKDSEEYLVQNVEVSDFISWKDGIFTFKNMALKDVAAYLIKYYNTSVSIDEEHLANTLISGKLVLSENITEVIQCLSKTIEGGYQIKSGDGYLLRK